MSERKALKRISKRAARKWMQLADVIGPKNPTSAQEDQLARYDDQRRYADGILDANRPPKITVRSEPRTYGMGSPNSWYADVALVEAGPRWDTRRGSGGPDAAAARLLQHAHEMATEVAHGTKAGRRAERQIREMNRGSSETDDHFARTAVKRFREFGHAGRPTFEMRTPMSTALGFGGELVTPVYLEQEYVNYLEAGRAFADYGCTSRPLPAYGMTVYIPEFSAGAAVAAQTVQNSGVQETDPTTGYLSFNLSTYAGQVVVSQQLLDRSGPSFEFDLAVAEQLAIDYNLQIDKFFLTQALANAGTVTFTASSFALYNASGGPSSGATFAGVVAEAKTNIRTTANVFQNANALFVTPGRLEFIRQVADANGRPLLVPSTDGPWNVAGTGAGDAGIDGPSGINLLSLPVFTDPSIPNNGSGYEQALVLDTRQVRRYEGTRMTRTLNQTLANDLSVIIQTYAYVGGYVRRPLAVQAITGTGLGTISWT